MLFATPRTMVSILHERDAADVSTYYQDNAAHLDPWEPLRTPDFHSERSWRIRGRSAQAEHRDDQSLRLIARHKATGLVAAACNFTGIQRGPFNACTLGYSVAQVHQGTGLMFEVASAALDYVFADLALHRVAANHVPENQRSAALLQRLGFEREGLAKSYLQIAGVWRDHVLTAKINPAHLP